MNSLTQNTEKEILLLLKGEDKDDGLQIVIGPDERIRLVRDNGGKIGNKKYLVKAGHLVQDGIESLVEDGIFNPPV